MLEEQADSVLHEIYRHFINGFHDAANSIATVVATRVLTPYQAVLWAATFNFLAVFVMGTGVAKTVGSAMIDLQYVTPYVILGGLIGAIAWDLITPLPSPCEPPRGRCARYSLQPTNSSPAVSASVAPARQKTDSSFLSLPCSQPILSRFNFVAHSLSPK